MKNIHVLSTSKPSNGYILGKCIKELSDVKIGQFTKTYYLMFDEKYFQPQNIYITSDEEIKKGDWILDAKFNLVDWAKYDHKDLSRDWSKIVLTTDQNLIKDGVQAIDDEFLEWFVKNPSCEEVELANSLVRISSFDWRTDYKIIIPKEKVLLQSSIDGEVIWGELKQETLEQAKQMMVTQEDILEQIALTEARGEKIVKYLNRYKGDSIYNEIALAIEFGYQLKLEEDEK